MTSRTPTKNSGSTCTMPTDTYPATCPECGASMSFAETVTTYYVIHEDGTRSDHAEFIYDGDQYLLCDEGDRFALDLTPLDSMLTDTCPKDA